MQKKELSKLVLTTLLTGSVLWGGLHLLLRRIYRNFPWTPWLLPQPEPKCQLRKPLQP